ADAAAVVHARWDLDPVALALQRRARAGARGAGVLDHAPAPAALWARLADREEALALRVDAATLAARAHDGLGARAGARAAAGAARRLLGNGDRDLGPAHRLVEGEVHLRAQIGAAGSLATRPAAVEQRRKDVTEVRGEPAGEV